MGIIRLFFFFLNIFCKFHQNRPWSKINRQRLKYNAMFSINVKLDQKEELLKWEEPSTNKCSKVNGKSEKTDSLININSSKQTVSSKGNKC